MVGMKRFSGRALGIAAVAVVLSAVLSGCFDNDLLQLARSISHNTFTLTVIASAGGTTTPSGAIEVTPSVPASISATASSGYQFINWEITAGAGASFGNSTAASTTVTLTSEDVTVRAIFSINQVATPQFSVPQGTYTSAQSIAITCATAGASIYYTTNGVDDPTDVVGPANFLYVAGTPIQLNVPDVTTEIRARAYKAGLTTSIVASSTYLITGTVANPAITPTPAAANPADSFSVAITCATGGATIRYTVNGDTPSSTVGTVYGGAFVVTRTCTVRAIAYKTNWADSSVISVNLTHAWVKNYGTNAAQVETAYGIVRASDNSGYYVAGQIATTGYNRRLMKISESGTVLWIKSYDEPGAGIGSGVVATSDGNVVTAGTNIGVANPRAIVSKINSAGTPVMWMAEHQPSSFEAAARLTIRTIKEQPDGSFIAAGDWSEDGMPHDGIILMKLYSTGDKQWAYEFTHQAADATAAVKGFSVDVRKSGTTVTGYVLVAALNQVGSSTLFDVLIVRTDSTGGSPAYLVYGGSSSNNDDQPYAVKSTSDGGFIVVGKSKSVAFMQADYDAMILKFSSAGALEWQRYYGAQGFDEALYAVEEVAAGVYLAAGETAGYGAGGTDAWVMKFDSTGSNFFWQRTYGNTGAEKATGICIAEDGGYFISGSTTSYGTNGDFWIMKLAADDGRPMYTSGALQLGKASTAPSPAGTLSALAVPTVSAAMNFYTSTQLAGETTATVAGWTSARQYQP